MSAIEYNNLLFEISRRLDELNVLDRLRFMFRGKLASGSEAIIQDALSLFKELEEQNILGADRLVEMKELLNGVEEWSLLEKVEKFESKMKEYHDLLEQIIRALAELNQLERLIAMCRGKISEESQSHIHDVRSLFKELENQNNLGIYHLDILKAILTEMERSELLMEVKKFEERRKQDAAIKRKKAKSAAFVSSVKNTLTGVLNVKTVFKAVAVVSTAELLIGWSTFDQLVTAVNTCVLPAGTSLVNLADGCVCLTVQAESLSALTTLWNLYQDGTLERRLYNVFVTDELKERAGGETVEVNVTIKEEEYDKACRELINEAREAASFGEGERIRRNSDSDVYSRTKEVPLLKLKHAETKLKFLKERIAVIEREFKQFSPEILEAWSPEERLAFYEQLKISEATEVGERGEKNEESDMSRRHKVKSMDPGKLAFVQKYLEDVHDTGSMTTEVSDSGLATRTAASELGTEEINEGSKLCLKDLSDDVTRKWTGTLGADEAALEKFYQFFGLKMADWYRLQEIKQMFPDTTVSVLKECFEVLRLYDLVEILEKVKPRSLHPAVSPEQIEKLRRADDRPTKYHSDVAVLIVSHAVDQEDIVEREEAQKIETFFKDLNSRNKVATIALGSTEETRKVLMEMKTRNRGMVYHHLRETSLERELRNWLQQKAYLEKELERAMKINRRRRLKLQLEEVKELELRSRGALEKVSKRKEQAERDFKKLRELEKERMKPISTALDEWIHNQEIFSCVAVFIISDDELYSEAVLEECVIEKLALIPDHAKLVVGPSEFRGLDKVPETLRVTCPAGKVRGRPIHGVYRDARDVPVFTRMIEIFNKRWQTLDLISMMQELKRTEYTHMHREYDLSLGIVKSENVISIKDSLSTLPTFQKKKEEHSS